MGELLIYGVNGYSGRQIASAALARGLKPIVAGRNAAQVAAIGQTLNLAHRCFDLHDHAAVRAGLVDIDVVMHCAGPFSSTAQPMLQGCIESGAHYLDISGEYHVFEAIAGRNDELQRAGIMAMPGTGMDVVPSDCLAAHMLRRMPDATHLQLYIRALERLSRGTATTFVENMGLPNQVRENGRLVERVAGADRRSMLFGDKAFSMVGMPWGDISTAWYTTGIPNIAVYMSLVPGSAPMIRLAGHLRGVLQSAALQKFLKAQVQRWISGPDQDYLANHCAEFIAIASNAGGDQIQSHLQTREGYAFTFESAAEIARRVLAGEVKAGFQTPGGFFGADFVLEIEGSQRTDL